MVYAVIGVVAFKNASRRDNAHAQIVSRLTPGGMFGEPHVTDQRGVSPHDPPDPAVRVEVRFLAEADRDAFFDQTVAALAGAQGPVTGSYLAKHECTHDEPDPGPCVEGERRVF